MSNIEIITSHKVDITFSLAPVSQRIFAFILDIFVIGFTVIILTTFISNVFGFDVIADNFAMLFLVPFVTFFTLASESLMNGQTLGKKALGIRVIKLNGERMEFADYLSRWIFRIVDIWFSGGSVAIISIVSTEKNQRLGDMLANTAVVQVNDSKNYKFEDVEKIMSIENYEVTYPEAKNFNEKQMLLIKEALERLKSVPNNTTRNALKKLSDKIASELQVSVPKQPETFLRTVLRDYIYLTR